MQVEEDIGRCLNEYKNVASLLRALHGGSSNSNTNTNSNTNGDGSADTPTVMQHDETTFSIPSFDAAAARGKGKTKKSKTDKTDKTVGSDPATTTSSSSGGGSSGGGVTL